ncbi:MAG: PadR family transcriptional regulator [Gemmatimonadota bacterium]
MPTRTGLGEFEMLVLAAVLRAGTGAYGAAVFGEVERTGRPVSMGAVYTTLSRLEDRGLLSSQLGDPTPVRGGRRTRIYRLEAEGKEALQRALSQLNQLLDGTDLGWAVE